MALNQSAFARLITAIQNNQSTLLPYLSNGDINLQSQCITDTDCRDLGYALQCNTSVKLLDLRNNSIGDIGASALATALPVNTALQKLYLADNSIRSRNMKDLAQALQVNTKLQTLDLTSNPIDDSGYLTLLNSLRENYVLTTLTLDSNFYSEEFFNLLSRNQQYIDQSTPNLQYSTVQCQATLLTKNAKNAVTAAMLKIDIPLQGASYPQCLNRSFTVTNMNNGQFLNAQQQPITTFSQAMVDSNQVFIQTDNSGLPFVCNITASDGNLSTCLIPLVFNVTEAIATMTAVTITTASPSTTTLKITTAGSIILATKKFCTVTTQTPVGTTTQILEPRAVIIIAASPATTVTITAATANTVMLESANVLTSTMIATLTPTRIITSTSDGTMNSFVTTPSTCIPLGTPPFSSNGAVSTSLALPHHATSTAIAAARTPESSNSVGIFAGVVAAGAAIVGAAGYWLYRRNRQQDIIAQPLINVAPFVAPLNQPMP